MGFSSILGVRSLCLSFFSVNFLICSSALCIIVLWRSLWAHGQAPAPSKALVGVFLEKTIALDLAWLYLFLEIRPWRFHFISAFVHHHCGYLICSESISIRPWKLYPSSTPPKSGLEFGQIYLIQSYHIFEVEISFVVPLNTRRVR